MQFEPNDHFDGSAMGFDLPFDQSDQISPQAGWIASSNPAHGL